MSTPLTFKSFDFDFYNRHSYLRLYVIIKYIPTKYFSQGVLTNIYLYGILLLKDIARRYNMTIWQEKGIAIAESDTVKKVRLGWQVPSQSGNGAYIVNMDDGEPFCTCQHFETTHKKCQHIYNRVHGSKGTTPRWH